MTTRKNHLGTISLIVAAGGFATLETLRHTVGLTHGAWRVLQAGFEAGIVGGLADWFAVSALFRPIPHRRFRIPHTGLLVEKRSELSDGIVDMVQNHWLSPAILAEHLQGFRASALILDRLSAPAARAPVVGAARELLERGVEALDAPEIAGLLDRVIREQLKGVDLAPAFGRWLERRIEDGDSRAVWSGLSGTLSAAAKKGAFEPEIRHMLVQAAEDYKKRGELKRVAVWLGEKSGIVDYKAATKSVSLGLARALHELSREPDNAMYEQLDRQLLAYAKSLASGDSAATATFRRLQDSLSQETELKPLISRMLTRLQETLRAELSESGANLSGLLDHHLERFLEEFRGEPRTQERVDAWVRRTITELVERNHGIIGKLVHTAIGRLSDADLVGQIEGKIGPDLQYIRLNGALVGGLIGVLLAITKQWLSGWVP